MPTGLVIMKWDERAGSVVEAKYPEEVNISSKTLMQVYSTHEYSEEAGMISLMVGSLNIASYYTGRDKEYYILLLLNLDEDPDAFEGGLADVARTVLQNLQDDAYKDLIPSLFQRLSVYPTLTHEQRLAMTYQDEIKRLVINRLRDEGLVSKSELMVWLKDKYKQGFIDLNGIITQLVKREIIKEASVKGMASESVFMTHDLMMTRVPPNNLIEDPADRGLPQNLVEDYRIECKKFFQNYRPSEEDNLGILKILIDPAVYETLRLLRTSIVTRNVLEKLKKKGVDDVDAVLKKLWDNQMIQVFQDERENEYYALISDFYLERIFPKYILNRIKREYEQRSKADEVLVEYLTILENTYEAQKEAVKAEE
ncbi:MAG: hypothetical protein R6U96_09835 [Promethearchaeia archaeon]